MSNVKKIQTTQSDLTPRQHLEAAEDLIASAEGMDDAQCAIADAEIAQAHLLASVVKLGLQVIGGSKRPSVGGLVAGSLLNLVK